MFKPHAIVLRWIVVVGLFFGLMSSHSGAAEFAHLPPLEPWNGLSQQLLLQTDDLTPAEQTQLRSTPNFAETHAYLEKLAQRSKHLNLRTIGQSSQGHELYMLVASWEGIHQAAAVQANGKPTILFQAGIHAGEIDGKDAGLLLMRDIVLGKELGLLKKVNILFIPMLSADGHQRMSAYNRVNQRGPERMGWRTNSQNLNLNRDYAKLQTPAVSAVVRVINDYQPDLYVDLHVTDGEDYQYDITYGFNQSFVSHSPAITDWLTHQLTPQLDQDLRSYGHIPGPLVFAVDPKDFAKGIIGWTASPRYSNGYGDIRHLPTILVENHSLKPYRQRVLGTYVLMKSIIEILSQEGHALQAAIKQDRQRRPAELVVAWQSATQPDYIAFKGMDYRIYHSEITGVKEIEWLGKAKNYPQLPVFWQKKVKTQVKVPKGYIVPPQYQSLIQRLTAHGIDISPVDAQFTTALRNYHQYRVTNVQFAPQPFEGQTRVEAQFSLEQTKTTVPQGSMFIATDQALGLLAVALLDPQAPDSFFAWGYFNSIFQRTEYIENYAIIPLAQQMLDVDPQLLVEFKRKLSIDANFADDPQARLDFFYQRTPYYDQSYMLYPVLLVY